MVPEGQFRICGDIACGVNELQVADEAAVDIAGAGVVDAVSSFEDSKNHFLDREMHGLLPSAVCQRIRAANRGFFQRDNIIRENPNYPDNRGAE